ncbi:MAG: sugar ABC transporter permease [Clostridia bacterium]|nr:sugar ABC transporter permease [Clostridia bacterium]
MRMKKPRNRQSLKTELVNYSFILPSLLAMLCFSLIPMVISLYISLTDWNFIAGIGNWRFIGLNNFRDLWTDKWFRAALRQTALYTVVTVPVGMALAVVLAAAIDRFCHPRLANGVRIAMYMPHICNIVATSAIWIALYSSYGPFTQLMRTLGWQSPPRFLANYDWALPAVMLVGIWSGLGYRVFIYSAAIQGLPSDLYEAADIDGASGVQKFFRITVPLLRPTTFFLTITGIIGSFKVFGTVNVMTGGGPGYSTYTLVYYIYKTAFSYYRMGYASSVAVVLFVILLIITLYQWNHNEKKD